MTSIYHPPEDRQTRQPNSMTPELIVLAPWMDSHPRHINKYILTYQRLFPSSKILVLRNELPDLLYRPSMIQQNRLRPAAKMIPSREGGGGKVLLHVFSNGGAHQACQFARLWKEEHGQPLPLAGLVLDSVPERGNYWRNMPALVQGLSRLEPMRTIGIVLLHLAVWCVVILQLGFGVKNVGEVIANDLLDPSLFPKVPRCYIYSREDSIVHWRGVRKHADDARKLEYPVQMVRFEGTKHVAHVIGNERRYWDAVTSLWNDCA